MERGLLVNVVGGATVVAALTAMQFIGPLEGEVRRTHPDPIGVTSACSGNRSAAIPGAVYTADECAALLLSDAIWAVVAARKLVTVPMNDAELTAVASWIFNVGVSAARDSTLVLKLNAGDRLGAAAEFQRWIHAGGKPLPGLVVRRAREARLFLS